MPTISQLFEGRIGRAHFAWAVLAFIGISIAVKILVSALGLLGDGLAMLGSLVSLVVFIAMAIVSFGVSVRRYHDFGWSGWYVLLGLIPLVNIVMLIVLLFKQGTVGANAYGEPFAKDVPLKEAILNKGSVVASAPVQAAAPVVASAPVAEVAPETPAATAPVETAAPTQEAGPTDQPTA